MLGVREETNASRAENGKGPAMGKEATEGAGMDKADDWSLTGLGKDWGCSPMTWKATRGF